MPTYSYQCSQCGHQFEEFHSMNDNSVPETAPCPKCNEMKIKQVVVCVPQWGDPVHLGVRKLPSEWRSFLKQLKKSNPGSCVNDR